MPFTPVTTITPERYRLSTVLDQYRITDLYTLSAFVSLIDILPSLLTCLLCTSEACIIPLLCLVNIYQSEMDFYTVSMFTMCCSVNLVVYIVLSYSPAKVILLPQVHRNRRKQALTVGNVRLRSCFSIRPPFSVSYLFSSGNHAQQLCLLA